MKKLLFILTVLATAGITAQESVDSFPVGGTHEFGLGLNYNYSYVTGDGFGEEEGYEGVDGYSLSVQYEYYFSKTWGIKSKLNLDYKGTETPLSTETLDLFYITLPVMATWHFGKRKRWYLHFGPYVGWLAAADIDGENVKDQFNSTDFGSDIGIGVRIPAFKGKWFFIELDGQSSFDDPRKDAVDSDLSLVRSTLGFGLIF